MPERNFEERLTRLEVMLENSLQHLNKEIEEIKTVLIKLTDINESYIALESKLSFTTDKLNQIASEYKSIWQLRDDVVELSSRVSSLEEKEKSLNRKLWDIAKLVAASIVGAIASILTLKTGSH